MGEKHEHSDDDQITFTIGKGNHSSICGGVAPMGIDGPQNEMEAHPTDTDDPAGVESEFRPGADTKGQLP